MYDICCIGHITLDRVITNKSVVRMPGGTSFYFSNAIRNMNLRYLLVTALADQEMDFVTDLQAKGINVNRLPSRHTVFFENNYKENQDYRTQRVLQTADPFSPEQLLDIEAAIFHLGPLLANDFSTEIIKLLSSRGKVSLDIQGYLRKVVNKKVLAVDWHKKKEALPFVDILKANELEMKALTGSTDVHKAARILYDWGVREIVITLGSRGSVIFDGTDFFSIPAYSPLTAVVDATGCGDTYMAGYLYQRFQGASFQKAGEFAATMATLKIESSGPFTGTEEEVYDLMKYSRRKALFDS
jgi:sugar/nucleoside kinase (ribokinase family)